MRKTIYYIVALSLTLAFSSCEGLKEQDLDPFYLELNEIQVKTTSSQGAPTHKIRDAWVLTQDRELGPFELPVTIPVLSDAETTEFMIFPGIRDNGQSGVPIIYPFIKPHEFTITANSGEVYNEPLVFEYFDNVIFEFVEDFGGSHVFTNDTDIYSGSELTVVPDEINPENDVARMYVNQDNPVCEVITASNFSPVNFSGSVYLEIDYKSEVPLVIGIQKNIFGNLQNEYIIILKQTDDYNKLYLDMSSYLADPDIGQFSLILNVDMAGLDIEEGEVFVDNVKLIHF